MIGLMVEKDQRQKRLYCYGGWTAIDTCPKVERGSELQKFEGHGHIGYWLCALCQ